MVALQQKAHALLRWLASRVDQGVVAGPGAHGDDPDAAMLATGARDWLQANEALIPWELRPRTSDRETVANLFASLLVTSFELRDERPTRAVPHCYCRCPLCLRLMPGSHLVPRRTDRHDERRARALQLDYVVALAAKLDVVKASDAIDALLDEPGAQTALAMATWAVQLLERSRGHDEGPALLVLWRRFAWTPGGAPARAFELDAEALLHAERFLAARLAPAALRVFRIEETHAVALGGTQACHVVSEPDGQTTLDAFGLRLGDALEIERPDGTIRTTTIAAIEQATPNPERRQGLRLGNDVGIADVPAGSWLRVPSPPAPRRVGNDGS